MAPVTVADDDRPPCRPYITEFTLPQLNTTPVILKRGSDNALWFTELAGNRIGNHCNTKDEGTVLAMPRVMRALALGVTAVVLLMPTVYASGQSGPAAGTGTLGPDTVTSVKSDGPNLIVEGTTTGVIDGTFNATFIETFRDVVHQDGSLNLTATVVFTGSTPCGVGTWTQRLVGKAEKDGTFSGQSTTIDQATSTVDVHTDYSFVGAGNMLSYSGKYRCT